METIISVGLFSFLHVQFHFTGNDAKIDEASVSDAFGEAVMETADFETIQKRKDTWAHRVETNLLKPSFCRF